MTGRYPLPPPSIMLLPHWRPQNHAFAHESRVEKVSVQSSSDLSKQPFATRSRRREGCEPCKDFALRTQRMLPCGPAEQRYV